MVRVDDERVEHLRAAPARSESTTAPGTTPATSRAFAATNSFATRFMPSTKVRSKAQVGARVQRGETPHSTCRWMNVMGAFVGVERAVDLRDGALQLLLDAAATPRRSAARRTLP